MRNVAHLESWSRVSMSVSALPVLVRVGYAQACLFMSLRAQEAVLLLEHARVDVDLPDGLVETRLVEFLMFQKPLFSPCDPQAPQSERGLFGLPPRLRTLVDAVTSFQAVGFPRS